MINQLNAPSPRSFLCRQDLESPFEAGNSLRTLKVVWQRIMIAQSTSGQVYTQPHRKTNHTSVPLNFGWQSCRCARRTPKPAAIGQLWFIGRHAGRTFLVLSNPDRCSWPARRTPVQRARWVSTCRGMLWQAPAAAACPAAAPPALHEDTYLRGLGFQCRLEFGRADGQSGAGSGGSAPRGHLEAGQRDVGPPCAWGASYAPPPARPAAPRAAPPPAPDSAPDSCSRFLPKGSGARILLVTKSTITAFVFFGRGKLNLEGGE